MPRQIVVIHVIYVIYVIYVIRNVTPNSIRLAAHSHTPQAVLTCVIMLEPTHLLANPALPAPMARSHAMIQSCKSANLRVTTPSLSFLLAHPRSAFACFVLHLTPMAWQPCAPVHKIVSGLYLLLGCPRAWPCWLMG